MKNKILFLIPVILLLSLLSVLGVGENYTFAHNLAMATTDASGNTYAEGFKFNVSVNLTLVNVTLKTGVTATRVSLYDASGNVSLQEATVTGGVANFSYNLTAGTSYKVGAYVTVGTYTRYWGGGDAPYPTTTELMTWIKGCYGLTVNMCDGDANNGDLGNRFDILSLSFLNGTNYSGYNVTVNKPSSGLLNFYPVNNSIVYNVSTLQTNSSVLNWVNDTNMLLFQNFANINYSTNTSIDAGLYGNNGSLVGYTFNQGTRQGGQSGVVFDGVDDYLINNTGFPDLGLNDLTLSAWIKVNNTLPITSDVIVGRGALNSDSNPRVFMRILGGSNMGRVQCDMSNGTRVTSALPFANIINDTNLHQVVCVFDRDGNVSVFKDNVLLDSKVLNSTNSYINLSTKSFLIGRRNIGETADSFNGSIYRVNVYHKALNSSERTSDYSAGANSPSPVGDGLVAQYILNDSRFSNSSSVFDVNNLVSCTSCSSGLAERFNGSQSIRLNSSVLANTTSLRIKNVTSGVFDLFVNSSNVYYFNGVNTSSFVLPFNGSHIGVFPNDTFDNRSLGDVRVFNYSLTPLMVMKLYQNVSYYRLNITSNFYNSSGGLYSSVVNFSSNVENVLSGLPIGLYFLNATSSNETTSQYSQTINFTIYNTSVNITSPSYLQSVVDGLNITYNASTTPTTSLTFNNYNISLLNASGSFNRTIVANNPNSSFFWHNIDENLSVGVYQVRVEANDTTGNKSSSNMTFNLTVNALLNVTARNFMTNVSIGNFTLNVTNLDTGVLNLYNVTTANINLSQVYVVKGGNYSFTLDQLNYSFTTVNYTANSSTYQNLTIYAYTTNSVYINIYNEATLLLLNGTNVSIQFITTNITTNYTSNGTFYADNLLDGVYTIRLTATNFSVKSYIITVNNRSTQTLNAYLTDSAYLVILDISDISTGLSIENVSITMEKLVGLTYILTDSKLSDVTGKAQFSYVPYTKYRFTLAKTGFVSKVFYLDPVLFATYTISMTPSGGDSNPLDFDQVSIVYYPKAFYNNQVNNFTFLITSPTGVLINYTMNITYPGGTNYSSGVLTNGETFLNYPNISGANIFSKVNLTYTYTSTLSGLKTFSTNFEIYGGTGVGNGTIAGMIEKNRGNTYGLGLFERALIVMLVLVILSGLAYPLMGVTGSLFVGMVVLAVAVFLGFLPIASIVISLLMGFAMIVSYSIGGNK